MSFIDHTPPRRPHPKEWRGYSLDELRYQRMLVGARLLIAREKLSQSLTGSASKPSAEPKSTFKTMMGYVDYLVTAISVWRAARKVFKAFKR